MADFHASRFRGYDSESLWRSSTAFVPKHYEPRYAYPLLVLFHGRGGDEQQLLRIMPQLSNRNYVAVALRGPERTRARRDGSVKRKARPRASVGVPRPATLTDGGSRFKGANSAFQINV